MRIISAILLISGLLSVVGCDSGKNPDKATQVEADVEGAHKTSRNSSMDVKANKAEPVLNWLRENGCTVEKSAAAAYEISWWKEECVGSSLPTVMPGNMIAESMVVLQWRLAEHSLDDLKRIKQAKIDYDMRKVESEKANEIIGWLKKNECEVKEIGECVYMISWNRTFHRSTALSQADIARLNESGITCSYKSVYKYKNGRSSQSFKYSLSLLDSWNPILYKFEKLEGIKQAVIVARRLG